MSVLLGRERQDLIRQRLMAEGRVVAAALAAEFGTSEDTIRRDLRELAAAGFCERVYGGAVPLSPVPAPLETRRSADRQRKAALAEALVPFIKDGATVFIDAGSTNVAVADALPAGCRLTVITNAPSVAMAASACGAEIVLVGGRLDPTNGACAGAGAIREVERLRPDMLILGACGVHAEIGVTAFCYEEAVLKRALLERSRAVLVAATNDKIGTAAPFNVAGADRLARLVVEHDCPSDPLIGFEALGVALVRGSRPAS